MHVFIDTNVLLSFFSFSKDDLDALSTVFASHQHGSATVHLTEQVRDEFTRNRENRIFDALKRFKEAKVQLALPIFMKGYEEYEAIQLQLKEIKDKFKAIEQKATKDIVARNLFADHLIKDIFSTGKLINLDISTVDQAHRRMLVGNPPGKNRSLGDVINWILLLNNVPDEKDLHVISGDGDFYSIIDESLPHPYLEDEWTTKKKSKLRVYRTIKDFLDEHFDGIAFKFDDKKSDIISKLFTSGSFATTHGIIAELEEHNYFSLEEVLKILDAAKQNSQVGSIVTDSDLCHFLMRVAMPRRSQITDPKHLQIVDEVEERAKILAELRS